MSDHLSKVNSNATAERLKNLAFFNEAHRKEIEEKNRIRVEKLLKQRKANRITGLLLGLGVISIYSYTIYAMKQETFLDDFNEPEKIHD